MHIFWISDENECNPSVYAVKLCCKEEDIPTDFFDICSRIWVKLI